ncbi:hypothetical protein FOA52_010886 [Chlamydomonas sp. UWO 241]|nr:hypothetical protein FOA52_010886 [Chlamydomonas sp. UWO 241]
MTKHNGKARKAGTRVGSALINRRQKGDPIATSAMFRHTTDMPNGQSVLDRGDLEELMALADLADRDFTAERSQVVVISNGAVDLVAQERDAAERRAAEERHRHRLRLPRRPHWDASTTPEQLELQERTSFLVWRRDLALLEEEERLVLTPFEKNLEVWRQLWRVLERSDIVVQVVDARDPLLYYSTDLENYARELHESKASFVLLNKADLLPPSVRTKWADYFDGLGLHYAFWSARAVTEEMQALKAEANELGVDVWDLKRRKRESGPWTPGGRPIDEDVRIRLLDGEELTELMEARAAAAVAAAGPGDPRHGDSERRAMVGLVGFPNVGKSSTINAIFGSKKTSVAPTPGKTKHFQTLNVSPVLGLCDCPGLVMPMFANSRSEMVAAGVIPIDRLTDIRGPVDVVARRMGRWPMEACYGMHLPRPAAHEPRDMPPSAMQALRSLATLRGWTAGSGLPDESRAGRVILRDYCNGKLVHCRLPPMADGGDGGAWVPRQEDALSPGAVSAADAQQGAEHEEESDCAEEGQAGPSERVAPADAPIVNYSDVRAKTKYQVARVGPVVADRPAQAGPVGGGGGAMRASSAAGLQLDAADLELMEGMAIGAGDKARRPEYKFNKKAARSKGDRGAGERGEGVFDGGAMSTGKKGGLVRVAGCAM